MAGGSLESFPFLTPTTGSEGSYPILTPATGSEGSVFNVEQEENAERYATTKKWNLISVFTLSEEALLHVRKIHVCELLFFPFAFCLH